MNKFGKSKLNSLYEELFKIRYPNQRVSNQKELNQFKKKLKLLLKNGLPKKEIFYELTSARNRELITAEEQEILHNTNVGFWGLSVGSHAALTWMMQSRAKVVKIVDPDTIDATNLNRLRFGWQNLGSLKISVVKKQLLEMNPYSMVIMSRKTDSSEVVKLVTGEPFLNVVVDAIDDISGKLLLRQLCKKQKIPLISAADVGDNVVVDVERYDLEDDLQFFLGRLPGIESMDLRNMTPIEKTKLIIQLVTFDQCSEKMLQSMLAIGNTIPTWPQLGATATLAGGIITTIIKKIVLGERVYSGRYVISLDDVLVADYKSVERKSVRELMQKEAEKKFK